MLKLLIQVWNLAATMGIWPPKLEEHEELDKERLNEPTRAQLLSVSGATIDRMLRPTRDGVRLVGLSGTKPGPLLRNSIQVRKAGDEHEQAPGLFHPFYGNEQTVINEMPLDEAVRNLPRDPRVLLDVIYERTKGHGSSPEEEALITIADTLRTGAIPADLRAALYKSAALIPGMTVVDRQATLDGRTGVAIGMEGHDGGGRVDIIIDPATGLLIGERSVSLKATADFPAGTATSWTSVQTSVVDSAP